MSLWKNQRNHHYLDVAATLRPDGKLFGMQQMPRCRQDFMSTLTVRSLYCNARVNLLKPSCKPAETITPHPRLVKCRKAARKASVIKRKPTKLRKLTWTNRNKHNSTKSRAGRIKLRNRTLPKIVRYAQAACDTKLFWNSVCRIYSQKEECC